MAPYKLILAYFSKFYGKAYFNKFNGETYQKKVLNNLYESLKIDNLSDKTIILTIYVKKKRNFFLKK